MRHVGQKELPRLLRGAVVLPHRRCRRNDRQAENRKKTDRWRQQLVALTMRVASKPLCGHIQETARCGETPQAMPVLTLPHPIGRQDEEAGQEQSHHPPLLFLHRDVLHRLQLNGGLISHRDGAGLHVSAVVLEQARQRLEQGGLSIGVRVFR